MVRISPISQLVLPSLHHRRHSVSLNVKPSGLLGCNSSTIVMLAPPPTILRLRIANTHAPPPVPACTRACSFWPQRWPTNCTRKDRNFGIQSKRLRIRSREKAVAELTQRTAHPIAESGEHQRQDGNGSGPRGPQIRGPISMKFHSAEQHHTSSYNNLPQKRGAQAVGLTQRLKSNLLAQSMIVDPTRKRNCVKASLLCRSGPKEAVQIAMLGAYPCIAALPQIAGLIPPMQ